MDFSINTLILIVFLLWPLISKFFGKGKQNKEAQPTSYEEIPTTSKEHGFETHKDDNRVFSWDELLNDIEAVKEGESRQSSPKNVSKTTHLETISHQSNTVKKLTPSDEFRKPGSRSSTKNKDIPMPSINAIDQQHSDFNLDFENSENLRNAIIYKEIFDKPISMRRK